MSQSERSLDMPGSDWKAPKSGGADVGQSMQGEDYPGMSWLPELTTVTVLIYHRRQDELCLFHLGLLEYTSLLIGSVRCQVTYCIVLSSSLYANQVGRLWIKHCMPHRGCAHPPGFSM
jgi:hypothetical protein